MAFTLAYLTSPVPSIPDPAGAAHQPRRPDRREHFGTEERALRRARELLPASPWLDLRLYGPDGRLLATQAGIAARLGVDHRSDDRGAEDRGADNPGTDGALEADHQVEPEP